MRQLSLTVLCAAAALIAVGTANAADQAAGKQLADGNCAACHGPNGIGIIPLYPNLAGQKREYLIVQLKAFREGTRKNDIMSPFAARLTDSDIENVATYFSLLK
jgi:cytochrome c553